MGPRNRMRMYNMLLTEYHDLDIGDKEKLTFQQMNSMINLGFKLDL